MSVLIRFGPASMTAQQYDEAVHRLEEVGDWPPDGLDYHVCFGSDGKLRVSEIWDSSPVRPVQVHGLGAAVGGHQPNVID